MASELGLFDLIERHSALSKANDPLEQVIGGVNFDVLRMKNGKVVVFHCYNASPIMHYQLA